MAGFAKKQSAMFGGMFDKMAASDAKKEAAKPKPAPTPVAGGTNAFGLKFLEENKDKEGAGHTQILTSLPLFSKWRKVWI